MNKPRHQKNPNNLQRLMLAEPEGVSLSHVALVGAVAVKPELRARVETPPGGGGVSLLLPLKVKRDVHA